MKYQPDTPLVPFEVLNQSVSPEAKAYALDLFGSLEAMHNFFEIAALEILVAVLRDDLQGAAS